ncbi:MAG TPA: CBS domain-containing protein [Stellaceae bacterium]|nr:CBS domain-containing protein [Stellaceae bacterium]
MNAGDVMTRQVVTVAPDTVIEEAVRLMLENRVSGLPVIDAAGAPIGVVTEGDLLRRIETGTDKRHSGWVRLLLGPGRLAAEYTRSHANKVGEVMTSEVVSVAPGTPLAEVVELMESRRIKRVPVVDGGKLVGIVSRANLVAALADMLVKERGAALSDDDIRQAILAEIDKQPWGPRESVDAIVTDGAVELHGTILDERERAALIVAAENLPGVKSVRDKLVWVEPNSGMVVPS